MKIRKSINGDKVSFFDNLCFWFMTLDILFLPYLSFMTISASVIFAVLWFLLYNRKIRHDYEWLIIILMFIFMVFGTVLNPVYTGTVRFETTFLTAIKRLFQYMICFFYYFFYRYYFKNRKVNLGKILFVFIIVIGIMATLYRTFPHEYAVIKLALNPSDNHTRRYLANMVSYRFNYLWTDPNNISYLVAGITGWFWLNKNCKSLNKIIVLLISTFIVFCTVSNGGMLTMIFTILIIGLIEIKKFIENHFTIKKSALMLIIFMSIICLLIFKFSDFTKVIYDQYITNFVDRLDKYGGSALDSSGGRFEDLKYGLSIISPITLVIGTGQDGFVTEIGHLYWIGMYGFPTYLIFMYVMFRKEKHQSWSSFVWVIPFFVGFTMNIAIGEFKWMAIYLMMLAYCRSGRYDAYDKMIV